MILVALKIACFALVFQGYMSAPILPEGLTDADYGEMGQFNGEDLEWQLDGENETGVKSNIKVTLPETNIEKEAKIGAGHPVAEEKNEGKEALETRDLKATIQAAREHSKQFHDEKVNTKKSNQNLADELSKFQQFLNPEKGPQYDSLTLNKTP